MRESAKISLAETKNYINSISNELTQDFKEVISGDWGLDQSSEISNVFSIDIEVFPDGYGLALYPSDNDLTQLGYKQLLQKYPDGPLRGDNYKHRLDLSSYDFENEQELKELDEYYDSLTKFYFEWISSCWDKAGGASFSKPIYIMMHDGTDSFDLDTKEWISDEAKWTK
jgi:hypothetical protein